MANQEHEKEKQSNILICQYWLKGHCLYGDSCRLEHPPSDFGKKKPSQKHHANKIEENKEQQDGSPRIETKLNKRTRVKRMNSKRHTIFRHWILDKIGRKILQQNGRHILDIAGGKGIFSFEMQYLNGINSILVDPRKELNLRRYKNALWKGYLHKNKAIQDKYIDIPVSTITSQYRNCENIKDPLHLQLFFDMTLCERREKGEKGERESGNKFKLSLVNEQYLKILQLQTNDNNNNNNNFKLTTVTCLSKNSSSSESDILHKKKIEEDLHFWFDQNVIEHCSLLVGIHPDLACEPIIDTALLFNKPFAVLPCCVFPNSFPHRRILDPLTGKLDKPVHSHQDFITYLLNKHPKFQVDTLEMMDGKNQVIYWIPDHLVPYLPASSKCSDQTSPNEHVSC
ncbi:hypothetical protein RFI_07765 [Reticulomyxa filosa]|uniref:C3H1-type domain-containing protein n=1 Tax=Reticulomyxa filosa TaxID=46433 RepID=X6NU97_RETFI|nr:hypothetical protein RFI_07765 [Reticulomyxa filosa]|eukprot:ETO29359.1 hypothetical protein RFI_07765 [Reticulomyxa filosa]